MTEQEQEVSGGGPGNERMVRDMERWKERIEISLDNRQVFFLFFGGAIVACLVFVLGVMVGKRLEARARDQMTPLRSDPLSVLDQATEEGEQGAVAGPPKGKLEPPPAAKAPGKGAGAAAKEARATKGAESAGKEPPVAKGAESAAKEAPVSKGAELAAKEPPAAIGVGSAAKEPPGAKSAERASK